jgi:hypothetical protein
LQPPLLVIELAKPAGLLQDGLLAVGFDTLPGEQAPDRFPERALVRDMTARHPERFGLLLLRASSGTQDHADGL